MNERIYELRKHLNLTQEELGNSIGITRGAVSKIESGDRNVTDQVIKAICREFNVDEIWLRTGEGEMFIQPDEDFAFLSAQIVSSDDDELKEITRMLWTLDVEELKALKSIIKKIKENPNL